MEVTKNHVMTIKFRSLPVAKESNLIKELCEIKGVNSVKLVSQMPFEDREYQLKTLLNSVSEGILAVDGLARVTHMNEVACRIFGCSQKSIAGEDARPFFASCPGVLDTLKNGTKHTLVEGEVVRLGSRIRIFVSSVPIINKREELIGAVFTIQDDKKIQAILSTVDRRRKMTQLEDIIYESQSMRKVVERARLVAKSHSTVLLRGESGTGKELFAQAIHMESLRRNHPFVSVNCGALPQSLLESELFGYEEGAFTGAVKGGKKGIFEQADHGTLFLDEIGEIPQSVQVQLLRVLQEGTIRKVGGHEDIPVDVRVIAATHRNLEEMIQSQLFREDLYYRLNVIPLYIPPLRERREDIPLIASYLVGKISARLNREKFHLTSQSMELLMREEWPGNVRQLENALERVINLIPHHLTGFSDGRSERTTLITPEDMLTWANLDAKIIRCENSDDALQITIPFHQDLPSLKEIVRAVEKQVLAEVLKKHPSSRQAGKALGISNTAVMNKIHAYDL